MFLSFCVLFVRLVSGRLEQFHNSLSCYQSIKTLLKPLETGLLARGGLLRLLFLYFPPHLRRPSSVGYQWIVSNEQTSKTSNTVETYSNKNLSNRPPPKSPVSNDFNNVDPGRDSLQHSLIKVVYSFRLEMRAITLGVKKWFIGKEYDIHHC